LRQPPLPLEVGDQPVGGTDLIDRFELRQNDPVHALPHDGDDVAIAPFGRHGIDPHVPEAFPRALISLHDDLARRHFLRDRAGILEVEDGRIGIEPEGLLDPSGVVAWREQERAKQGHRRVSRVGVGMADQTLGLVLRGSRHLDALTPNSPVWSTQCER